jgi:hypothetical protein
VPERVIIPTTFPAPGPAAPSDTPDLNGFRAAQVRLHGVFATGVTFIVPVATEELQWPVGTTFDPETGMPFDPVIQATGDVQTTVAIPAEVVHRTTGQGDQTTFGALGWVEGANMALIIRPLDKQKVEQATEAVVFGERQRIMSFRPDGIQPNVTDRWLVFLEGE